MLFESSIGIHFSRRFITVVYLKDSFRKITLQDYTTFTFENEKNLNEKINASSAVIRNFLSENRLSTIDIFISIPDDAAILKELEYPASVKDNLRSTLQYDIEKHIPLSVDDVYMDFQIIQGSKSDDKVRISAAVAKKKSIDEYMEIQNYIDMEISGIEIQTSAVVNYISCMKFNADTIRYAFILESDSGVDVGFIDDQLILYSRTISNEITHDAATIIKNELIRMKTSLVSGDGDLTIFTIKGEKKPIWHEIISQMDGVHLIPIKRGELPSNNYIPAFGAALKGLRKTNIKMNFVPVQLRKRPDKTRYYVMTGLIGAVIVFSLLLGAVSILEKKRLSTALDLDIKRLASEVESVYRLQEDIHQMEAMIDQYNAIKSGSVSLVEILREISEILPESAWVQDFNLSGRGVQIEGYAQSASELITIIEASPLFKNAVFLSTITKNKEGRERFQIGLEIL